MHDALIAMLNADPDGMPKQPTDEARAKFRAWAIDTYGQAAWDRYLTAWNF